MKILEGFGISHGLLRDPIYNFIELPNMLKPILDHPIMQRLRRISQAPLQDMLYPSANHTRFEHSIGCMHLSIFAITSLIKNSKETILDLILNDGTIKGNRDEEKIDQLILAAATIGLLHDIGHGPFSHTLEDAIQNYNSYISFNSLPKEKKISQYDHEIMTQKLCYILENEFTELSQEYFFKLAIKVLTCKDLVKNNKATNLHEILHNLIDNNIFDVDKGDYLLRDSYHCGTTYGIYDFYRLWDNIILYKDTHNDMFQIYVKEKASTEVWSLQFARFSMYQNVYEHHIRQVTDATLCDLIRVALTEEFNIIPFTNNNFNIIPFTNNNNIDLEKFINWGDDTLWKELFGNERLQKQITRFRNRKIFKPVTTIKIKKHVNIFNLKGYISSCLRKFEISETDVLIHFTEERSIAPVFEKNIQKRKIILKKNFEVASIAEYFDFMLIDKNAIREKEGTYNLSIFLSEVKLSRNKDNISVIVQNIINNLHDNMLL